jgi:hypothetical protein
MCIARISLREGEAQQRIQKYKETSPLLKPSHKNNEITNLALA